MNTKTITIIALVAVVGLVAYQTMTRQAPASAPRSGTSLELGLGFNRS